MEQILRINDCRDFPIEIPTGYYMSISFTTQAANEVKIKLYDEKKTYLEARRRSTEATPVETREGWMEGESLYLRLDIPESCNVEVRKNQWDITGENGELLARSIVILAEDSYDYDYNDVVLTITAWRGKG